MKHFIIILIIIATLAGGGYFYASQYEPAKLTTVEEYIAEQINNIQKQISSLTTSEKTPEIEAKTITNVVLEEDQELGDNFEEALNTLIQNVAIAVADYKKERPDLGNLIENYKLEDPKYVEKRSLEIAEIAKSLQDKANQVMLKFKNANKRMRELIKQAPETEQAAMTEKWQTLMQQNMTAYYEFFKQDIDTARAESDLMNFYKEIFGTYRYDPQNNNLSFTNKEDQSQVQTLRLRINRARRQNAEKKITRQNQQ